MTLTSTVNTLSGRPLHGGMMANATLGTRPYFAMEPKKAARFPRSARLLRHADFERVYKQGRRHFSASMTVFYWARPDGETPTAKTPIAETPTAETLIAEKNEKTQAKTRARVPAPAGLRVGFTVGRALGGAVQRNRMKRRLREAVRMSPPIPGVAADVVINPKKSLLATDFAAVLNEVSRAFAVIEQKLSGKHSEKAAPEVAADRFAGKRKPESRS